VQGPIGPQGIQGPIGPDGIQGVPGPGNSFQTVATASALPAAASNTGRAYYVIDTAVIVVSDGTRWRTVYGDTGIRAITTWDSAGTVTGTPLLPGWKPRAGQPGYVRLRRTNHTVFCYTNNIACAVAGTSDSIMSTPAGFVPEQNSTYMLSAWSGTNVFTNFGLTANSSGGISRGSNFGLAVDTYLLSVEMAWATTQAWPATLPGSVVSNPN